MISCLWKMMSCCSKTNTCIQIHWRSFNQKNMKRIIQNDVNYECEKIVRVLFEIRQNDITYMMQKKRSDTHRMKRKQQMPPQNASYTSRERSIDRLLNSLWNDKPETYIHNWIRAYVMGIYGVLVSYKLNEIEYAAPQTIRTHTQ